MTDRTPKRRKGRLALATALAVGLLGSALLADPAAAARDRDGTSSTSCKSTSTKSTSTRRERAVQGRRDRDRDRDRDHKGTGDQDGDGVMNEYPIDTRTGTVPTGDDTRKKSTTTRTRTTVDKALVLYDDEGDWGYLGELYGIAAGNLASHFGARDIKPVSQYTAGMMSGYTGVIYIGSTYKDANSLLPAAFLDDVLAGTKPVIWVQNNIWQLSNRTPDFVQRFGFEPWAYDTSTVAEVRYKGTSFSRYAPNMGGILQFSTLDTTKATVLAEAVRADGTTLPWAVRSGNLTYIGENPIAYMSENDRYLVFSDLLTDALAPAQLDRNRALVRLEDIGPDADPEVLRQIADYFASEQVPFSFIVYPAYRDPAGVHNGGVPEAYDLKDRPEVVAALKYMISKGGTMVQHGYTHQLDGNLSNPYDGTSGNDFEFYTAHEDPTTGYVVLDGPVPGDSYNWARDRMLKAQAGMKAACLPIPTIWEFPHYAASAVDYKAAASLYSTRYDRTLYFKGVLTGTTVDHSKLMGQFFPYKVKDVYGTTVLPENLGNYEPEGYNQHPPRHPADILATASKHLALRDTVASFFYHPYEGLPALQEVVSGMKGMGFQFVAPSQV